MKNKRVNLCDITTTRLDCNENFWNAREDTTIGTDNKLRIFATATAIKTFLAQLNSFNIPIPPTNPIIANIASMIKITKEISGGIVEYPFKSIFRRIKNKGIAVKQASVDL